MKLPPKDRRLFLKMLLAAGWLGICAGFFLRETPLARRAEKELAAGLLGKFFTRPESAAAVGQKYLEQFPAERRSSRLVQVFLEGAALTRTELFFLEREELRKKISRAVKADFRAGRTVRVDGWMLSATEARLCAVAALR